MPGSHGAVWRPAWMAVALLCSGIGVATAHGFGQRYDLPVPLWLYVAGAAATVALSFVVVGVLVRSTPRKHSYPRLPLLRSPVGRLLAHPACLFCLQLTAVCTFVLVVLTGLLGDQHPRRNLAPTLVWIVWWVGLAYISALGGNLWVVLNPWRILFAWFEFLYRRCHPSNPLALRLPYPKALGQWPGLALFLAFAWVELVFAGAAVPADLALLALVYTGITWTGMLLFGTEIWLKHGEAFSLAFGLLARFSPTEVRVIAPEICSACRLDCRDQTGACVDCYACFRRAAAEQREWNVRPFAVGLLRHETVSTSEMAFVLLLLGTVTFDGLMATPLWAALENVLSPLLPAFGEARLTVCRTLGLIALPLLFGIIYGLCGWLMAVVSGQRLSSAALRRTCISTLVPIAIAYHIAHYFSFLLTQGQFIVPLLSDPFGWGWNLLGTADYQPDIGLVGARCAWFTAVMALVTGHIIAVYLAHRVALRVLCEPAAARRSQYPMLVLMLGYTMLSLWLLAQPIVENRPGASVAAESAPPEQVVIPPDALLPEPGSGVLRAVGTGQMAAAKLTYRVLNSAFHDGTRMTVADLLYPYILAYRWGIQEAPDPRLYDPYVARVTAMIRERLAGLRVVRVDRNEQGLGELRLVHDTPVIEVYVRTTTADPQHVAALTPPWSSVPWHLMVLMEEAVQRGWAAFSFEAAQRQGVRWLDLVRDRQLQEQCAALIEDFARQGYIPETLQHFATTEEARQRWTALHTFFQTHRHFLVSNGPYSLAQWSEEAVVLQVFRDPSYPLGVGSYDHYALPRRAYVSRIEPSQDGLAIHAEVERLKKYQRTYDIVREPLKMPAATGKPAEIPLCRYVVTSPDGSVAQAGTAAYTGSGVFHLGLRGRLRPGLYTIMIALYLNENYVNPDIKIVPYKVTDSP